MCVERHVYSKFRYKCYAIILASYIVIGFIQLPRASLCTIRKHSVETLWFNLCGVLYTQIVKQLLLFISWRLLLLVLYCHSLWFFFSVSTLQLFRWKHYTFTAVSAKRPASTFTTTLKRKPRESTWKFPAYFVNIAFHENWTLRLSLCSLIPLCTTLLYIRGLALLYMQNIT